MNNRKILNIKGYKWRTGWRKYRKGILVQGESGRNSYGYRSQRVRGYRGRGYPN